MLRPCVVFNMTRRKEAGLPEGLKRLLVNEHFLIDDPDMSCTVKSLSTAWHEGVALEIDVLD